MSYGPDGGAPSPSGPEPEPGATPAYGAPPPSSPPPRKRPVGWIAGGVGVLVALVLSLYACGSSGGAQPPSTPPPSGVSYPTATTTPSYPPSSAVVYPPVTSGTYTTPTTPVTTSTPYTTPTTPYTTPPTSTLPTKVEAGSGGAAGDSGGDLSLVVGGLALAAVGVAALTRGRRRAS